MLNVLLAAAMSYPGIFANEYCWARHHGEAHEAAIELAKGRWGGLIYNQEAEDPRFAINKKDQVIPNPELYTEDNPYEQDEYDPQTIDEIHDDSTSV